MDYTSQNSHLTLTKKDIKEIKKGSFSKGAYVTFYSCNTAAGGKSSFAYKWFKHLKKTKGYAYEGKTDYSCINVEGGEKGWGYIWDKITGHLEEREYPTASLNYPTGKGIVRYEDGNRFVCCTDRPWYQIHYLPIRA